MQICCGTSEHENIKAQQRERKREKYTNLFGTSEHENIKLQRREKYTNLFGTSEHESIKKRMFM